MAQGRITYGADGDYVDKQLKEFTLTQEVIEKLDSIEPGAERNYIQGIKVNGEPQTPDQYRVVDLSIPEVEDTLSSYDNTAALSARQGRVLYNYIRDLQQVGHFLSNWNCSTGLPQTNPQTNPYVYNTGDYFIVSNVSSGTNYKPNGSQYIIGQASITVESDEVKVGDFYVYDGTNWLLLINTERQIAIDTSLSTTSTNPVENRVITNALNLKANDADISTVGKTNDYNDIDNLPSIPDSLDDLSGDSDDIIEGSAHLFLTQSERTNLSHQSGVNTGDENQGSIKQKLGAASSSSDGYLTSTDRSTFNDKQDEISDLSDIRSNATAGKNASDTIATYGDVVTHDTNEFATAAQGAKADTALQSGDNVSELVNDAGYITDAYHDDTKQDKLIAGTNIQIAADGKTVSATDTTYVAGDFDIKDLADSTGLRTEWSGKQDELIAGNNIQIAADGKTISATDTTYSAGTNISIDANNQISAVDTTYTAGTNITIDANNEISAVDTTYTAGTGIDITNGVISNTQTSAEWGNITGTLSDQTDLQSALDAKQDDMVILSYGNSTWNDFITAYNKNGVVYCRASSNSNPATGSQTRLAFMAYVNNATTPTEVEFQYYRSRADHNSAANQLDQVFVYKLTSASGGTWTVTERNTAAKSVAGTGISLGYGSGNMTISNTGVTSVNSQTGDVTVTVPTKTSDLTNDSGFITSADIPALDTSMSDSSTAGVQNKVIKSYVDTQVQEATSGAVSDTAYGSDWNGVTGIAPSKNAVYDKISAMDTTISGKQDTISDLATIRTGAGKGATAVQPLDNVSTLTNDAGFITKAVNDLTNYYTKSETYTKAEVADYVANFAGFKVVSTLPTTDIKTTIIYLLGPIGSGADKYEEYIYSNNTWVKIGETSVDLTNYFNTSTQTSDNITQGSTNLFLTSAERTKLSNTSGTNTGDETESTIKTKLGITTLSGSNTGDETTATIKTKLGAATSSADGYLKKEDFATFNGKQDALATQTAYTSKGTSTKVPTITTNTLGQVTSISETNIAFPVTSVNGSTGEITGLQTISNLKTDLTDNSDTYYPSQKAVKTAIDTKQDILVNGTNIKTINNESILGSGNIVIQGGGSYTAGEGIGIVTGASTKGPCPDGFHIPLTSELVSLHTIWVALGGGTADGTNFGKNLKIPFAGNRTNTGGTSSNVGTYGFLWSASPETGPNSYVFRFTSNTIVNQYKYIRSHCFSIRPFKDTPVIPTSSWTKMYGTSIEAGGIFWSATDGLVSLSSDGQTWVTISDKNCGATTVWNYGDTLTNANCGNMYQWGNNYGFPFDGTITTSPTQVDAGGYGPGNYYSSDVFIRQASDWSSVDNSNLWGGEKGLVIYDNAIVNVGDNGKLDKVGGTATLDRVYVVNTSGVQTTYNVSQGTSNNAIVRRSGTGIIVPDTPGAATHAVNKNYVDGIVGDIETLLAAI